MQTPSQGPKLFSFRLIVRNGIPTVFLFCALMAMPSNGIQHRGLTELHLDVSGQQEPFAAFFLDVSTVQGHELHLDVSTLQGHEMYLDVSTLYSTGT